MFGVSQDLHASNAELELHGVAEQCELLCMHSCFGTQSPSTPMLPGEQPVGEFLLSGPRILKTKLIFSCSHRLSKCCSTR